MEAYRIDQLWLEDENVDEYIWVYGDEIIGYLDKVKKTSGRIKPYALRHPVMVNEIWQVSLPAKLRLDDLDAEIDNEWMHFRKTHELDASGTQLTVSMTYETKVDEVAGQDLAAFRRAVLEVEDAASFYIENTPRVASANLSANAASDADTQATMAASAPQSHGLLITMVILVSALLTWLGLFLVFRRLDKAAAIDS